MLFTRRGVVRTAAALAPAVWFGAREAMADSDASQISRDAAAALRRLDTTDHRAVTLGQKAAGVLVFPKIVKAGFIFGGQGGKGVLTEHGHTHGYYSPVGNIGDTWCLEE
jgi:lipid-binding SYLF domain-containing protein